MQPKPIPFPWRANAVALALGLAIIGSAGLARSDTTAGQATQQAAASARSDFTCHAKPGGWCDLRDWSGFGAPAASSSQPQ